MGGWRDMIGRAGINKEEGKYVWSYEHYQWHKEKERIKKSAETIMLSASWFQMANANMVPT